MSQYRLTLDEAMSFPLEAYLALLPAMIHRHGGDSQGPDHCDRASSEARARCKAFLRKTFRILPPGQPAPANALARWIANHSTLRETTLSGH